MMHLDFVECDMYTSYYTAHLTCGQTVARITAPHLAELKLLCLKLAHTTADQLERIDRLFTQLAERVDALDPVDPAINDTVRTM